MLLNSSCLLTQSAHNQNRGDTLCLAHFNPSSELLSTLTQVLEGRSETRLANFSYSWTLERKNDTKGRWVDLIDAVLSSYELWLHLRILDKLLKAVNL